MADRVKLDDIGCCSTIPGYVRGAYLIYGQYGREVGKVCTKMKFAVCVHLNRATGDTLVELFRQLPENENEDAGHRRHKYVRIGANDFHRLVDSHPLYGKYVVYLQGQPFLRGCDPGFDDSDRSNDIHRLINTNGFVFLRSRAHDLATALTYPDTVKTLDDGKEFNMLVDKVLKFYQEMDSHYNSTTAEINSAKAFIKISHEKMLDYDNDLRAEHERRERAVATLESYGIDYNSYICTEERIEPWL